MTAYLMSLVMFSRGEGKFEGMLDYGAGQYCQTAVALSVRKFS